MEKTNPDALPHWNLGRYYPGLASPEFVEAFDRMKEEIGSYAKFVSRTVAAEAGDPVSTADQLLRAARTTLDHIESIMPYVYGHLTVNSRDELAQRYTSELQMAMIPFNQANTRLTTWLGQQDADALIAGSDFTREHEFMVRQALIESQHMMSQAEEDLASELTNTGGTAFGKLHGDLTSQILVKFEKRPGEFIELPMSDVRNLAMDPDRDVRRRAFDAEIDAWRRWETPIAAALNGVKGEHTTIARRRRWESALDESLFQNHIDRETLDAMMAASHDAFPDIRRYFEAKARVLGLERLAWYDVTAPVGESPRLWSWTEGMDFIKEQFGSYSPKMRALAEQALDEDWIDAEPRSGKVGGAYCMPTGNGRSAVLSNYTPSFDGVSTMAHELGHAYHNLCQKERSVLQRAATPMTLAETASTFCETILRKAAIAGGTEEEAFAILEGGLVDAGQIVIDITSRFLFEQAVFAERSAHELSASRFNELMLDAQRQTYGEAIDPTTLHPYMWAVKGHYYSPTAAFYNYPYMFGLLFGLGLYAQYIADPDSFRTRYDDLLASTGSADAANLASSFGFDIRSRDFWDASLDVIRADIDRFVEIVNGRLTVGAHGSA